MRSIYRALILSVCILFVQAGKAQCSNFVTQFPSGIYSTANSSWVLINSCIYGGEYSAYNVAEGATYTWTTCYSSSFTTEMTLWNVSHSASLAYSLNACPNRAEITWTATFTGVVHVLTSMSGCTSSNQCATLYWKMVFTPPAPANNGACVATPVANASECNYQTFDNNGATNSGVASPGCGSYNGGDVWFKTVVPASGVLTFKTRAGIIDDAAIAVYRGTCSGLILIACDDDSGPGYMPQLNLTGLVPTSTIFIRIWSYSNSQMGTFDLCIQEPCSSAPASEFPCNANVLIVGSPMNGTNACATATGQPAIPSCFTAGHVGSAWYKFVSPVSGSVFIETTLIGIASTQIGLYSGTCYALTAIACNQDKGEGCGNNDGSSSIYYSGLAPGTTYFVRVDGENDDQGTFSVLVGNTLGIIPIPGQDCASPIELCATSVFLPNPGVQGTGNFCDFDGTNNCTSGERNSIWYKINIGATGNLNFIIKPNDANSNSCGSETDYDFVLWKISGSGATTNCGTMTVNPTIGLKACSYDSRGVTGVSPSGNAPSPYNACYNPSFEPTVSVTAGDILLLVVQNFAGTPSGYTLDFGGSGAGVVSIPTPTMVYWNGSTGTSWNTTANWGCGGTSPSCTIDATIRSGVTNYPVISGNMNVRDLVILPGGQLTLNAGTKLTLCGTLYNFGKLIIDSTATLTFSGTTGNQDMKGNFAGLNAIGNLEVNKSAGSVNLYSNLEIKGDFRTLSATSVFNTRDNQIDLHKSFNNFDGSNTYSGVNIYGELNFIGTTDQIYNQGTTNLNLNKVTVNKTAGNVLLSTDIRLKASTAVLTLNRGKIITGANMVWIGNSDPISVTEGNPASYVEGILRRYVNNTGIYDFPIGRTSVGYQRARINFTSNAFSFLTAEFKAWAPIAGPLYQAECQGVYDRYPLDHGYFDINANTNPTSAMYDMTLYNSEYSNSGGAQGWTIMKDSGAGWALDGNCQNSSAGQVSRTGMTGISKIATSQSSTPLPIELLSFEGKVLSQGNQLQWATASEINNDIFIVESSRDGELFQEVGRLDGAGNSSSGLHYELHHTTRESGVFYYRLTQRDFDGTESSSDVIALERGREEISHFLFPNPNQGQAYVHLDSGIYSSWAINDMTGRKIAGDRINRSALILLDLSGISEGVYVFSLHDREGNTVHIERIVKEK
jgi:hypothetical protein